MICSGIPIRQVFYEEHDKADAKKQMGIDASKPHILMMCGSMGCGPMKRLVRLLKDEDNIQVTVVCGTNKRLYRRLSTRYAGSPNLHIRGYERNMPLLMDSADLYLTKPGGLSTTEAYVKNLPMVCIDAVAGCEEYNRRYYVEKGAARSGKTAKELQGICKHLLTNQGEITEMQTNLSNIPKTNAAETIYRSMAKLLK